MPPYLLRLAYVAEFLLALIAVFTLWGQVGGQYHLDIMPWYDKLVLGGGLAFVTVLGTAAAVSGARTWNWKTIVYALLAVILIGAMAAVTVYYHLHEPEDDDDDASPTTAMMFHR